MSRVDNNLLIDYIHHALSDSDKRRVEALLREDETIRRQVSDLRHLQQDIKQGISAEINAQMPSHNMTYGSIAATVREKRPRSRYGRRWQWLSRGLGFVALFVLGFAFTFSMSDRDNTIQEGGPMVITPTVLMTPTLEPALKVVDEPALLPTETPTVTPGARTVPSRTATPDAPQDSGQNNIEAPPDSG